jgi:hypothetical protein
MPDMENQTTDSNAKWSHQTINETCPRFAMMQVSVEEGLAHRFSEVSTRHCLELIEQRKPANVSMIHKLCILPSAGTIWFTVCV